MPYTIEHFDGAVWTMHGEPGWSNLGACVREIFAAAERITGGRWRIRDEQGRACATVDCAPSRRSA